MTFWKSILPVSISYKIMPAPQTSHFQEQFSSYLFKYTSGPAQRGVPICPVTKILVVYLASPKSLILISRLRPRSILSGFKSRCILPIKDEWYLWRSCSTCPRSFVETDEAHFITRCLILLDPSKFHSDRIIPQCRRGLISSGISRIP